MKEEGMLAHLSFAERYDLPLSGVGTRLRRHYFRWLLKYDLLPSDRSDSDVVALSSDWFDLSAGYLAEADSFDWYMLERIRSRYPVVVDGLSLGESLSISKGLSLKDVEVFVRRIEPTCIRCRLDLSHVLNVSEGDSAQEALLNRLVAQADHLKNVLQRPLVFDLFVDISRRNISDLKRIQTLCDKSDSGLSVGPLVIGSNGLLTSGSKGLGAIASLSDRLVQVRFNQMDIWQYYQNVTGVGCQGVTGVDSHQFFSSLWRSLPEHCSVFLESQPDADCSDIVRLIHVIRQQPAMNRGAFSFSEDAGLIEKSEGQWSNNIAQSKAISCLPGFRVA